MKLGIIILTLVMLGSTCNPSNSDFAIQWSNDIKQNIFEDVNIQSDSFSIDSSDGDYWNYTFFNNNIRTKFFRINQNTSDTLVSIFYSKNQKFELVRELCPNHVSSFEGIRYNQQDVGSAEFKNCNGILIEQGFRYGDNVGIWKEWDGSGNLIKETDHGNSRKLNELKQIKYYR